MRPLGAADTDSGDEVIARISLRLGFHSSNTLRSMVSLFLRGQLPIRPQPKRDVVGLIMYDMLYVGHVHLSLPQYT